MASSRRTNPIRCFIDASVLFAASQSATGWARDLILAGARGQVALIVSPFVIDETRRNLSRKSSRSLPLFEAFVAQFNTVSPPAALVRQVAATIALKDAPVVAGAIHADAPFLVTYDRKHLLSKRQEIFVAFGITVATPNEFLASLEESG
jgi:predicted nucleic acid-binding protein